MKKLRIIMFIVLQTTIFCFASDEKKVVLSQEDDAWLGNNLNTFLNSERPQVDIVSFISGAITHRDLRNEGMPYLQKNINHAKNWLFYFNEKKVLATKDQLEFCRVLNDSAAFIKSLGGERDFETKVFLELLPLGVNIKGFQPYHEPHISRWEPTLFDFICPGCNQTNSFNTANGFIYYYKPSLTVKTFTVQHKRHYSLYTFFNDIRKHIKFHGGSVFCDMNPRKKPKLRLNELLTPTMYELTDDKVIRNTYKGVQDIVCKKRTAEIFLLGLKVNKVKIPRPVREGIIFKEYFDGSVQNFSSRYKSAIEFNNYCNYVKKEVCREIEWIQKNDPRCYQKILAFIPFLKTPESFKEWYEGLKFPKENPHN